ncbi:MAG TPA: hypothetical protein VGC73_00990, partial [Pyrinomonadaceae bacterium]
RSNRWAEISERLRRYSSISIGVFIQFQTDALLDLLGCKSLTPFSSASYSAEKVGVVRIHISGALIDLG